MAEWIPVLLHRLSQWPLRRLHAIGAVLGWIVYLASPTYRRCFRQNTAQAGLSRREARPAIAAAGRMLTELPPLWLRPAEAQLRVPVEWQGGELIERAHEAGRGLVMLTPHLGCFEVVGQSYAERYGRGRGAMTVLYRPARKPWLRPLVEAARRRPGLEAAPASLAGVRQMIRALRRGEVVGLLPDQVPPEGQGVWVPFFGRPAYTMTLAARLVQQTGAALLLIWGERLPEGAGYRIQVSEIEEDLPDDVTAAAATINRAMERLIRQAPEQYLWGYHRYNLPRGHRTDDDIATRAGGPQPEAVD